MTVAPVLTINAKETYKCIDPQEKDPSSCASSTATSTSSDDEESNNHEYSSFVKETKHLLLQKAQKTCPNTTWSSPVLGGDSGTIVLTKGTVTDSPFLALHTTTTINASIDSIKELLESPDRMHEYDPLLASNTITHEITSEVTIRHVVAKAVFPTTARDFTILTSVTTDDDESVTIVSRSIEHPDLPPKSSNVRAQIIISGYVLRQISPNETSVIMVCHTDVGAGSVPAFVINKLSSNAPVKMLAKIKKVAESS